MEKKLQRIPHEGAVAGVCAGLGVYFGVDKTWMRLAFIVSVFFSGYMGIGLLGPVIYIVLWIVLPVKSFVLPNDPFDVDYRAPSGAAERAAEGFESHAHPSWSKAAKPTKPRASRDRYVAGLILVILGVFFLLHQLDFFYWRDFARFWPVLIILSGLATIFGAFKPRKTRPFPPDEPTDGEPINEKPADPADGTGDSGTDTK